MIFRNLLVIFASSLGYALMILVSVVLQTTLGEYDCSAKEDGWYYDPNFCHVYWRCIHGTSEEFECASGTAWDHRENRCNWLDDVDCLRAEQTTEEVTVEEPSSGVNGGDDDSSAESTRKPGRTPRILYNGGEDFDLSSVLVCQVHASAEIFCAGRDGFFAHPDYCTRYYRCAHGVDQGFECPKGTAWDEESKSCAWIDQVNCEEKKLDYSTTSITTEDSTTTIATPSTSSRTTSETDSLSVLLNRQPGRGRDVDTPSAIDCQPTGIYFAPDPTECSSYYQCDRGVRTQLNCQERQLFDVYKRQCIESERVVCGSRPLNLVEKNQCISKRDGIHPDVERDCHYYYQCVSQNKMREARCPGDQKYVSYLGRCAPSSLAPMPCGPFVLGTATKEYHRKSLGILISFLLTIIICSMLDL